MKINQGLDRFDLNIQWFYESNLDIQFIFIVMRIKIPKSPRSVGKSKPLSDIDDVSMLDEKQSIQMCYSARKNAMDFKIMLDKYDE